jgi:hypothetical protein
VNWYENETTKDQMRVFNGTTALRNLDQRLPKKRYPEMAAIVQ